MVIVLGTALDIHAAGIPIPLLGNALRAPMSPHSELSVSEPVRASVCFQRFPIRTERVCDRRVNKIAGVSSTLLRCCSSGGCKHTCAARDELSPIELTGFSAHQITF